MEVQGENMSVSLSNLKRGMHVVTAACDTVHDNYLQQGHMWLKKQLLSKKNPGYQQSHG